MKLFIKNNNSEEDKKNNVKDNYEVIMAGNIMVAQGYKCSKCNLIRPYFQPNCNCS